MIAVNEWGYTPEAWKALTPGKRWAIKNRERMREQNRKWRENNRDKVRESKRKHYANPINRAKRDADQLAWKQRRRDHVNAYNRAYEARRRAKPAPRLGEVFGAALAANALYATVSAVIPRGMPRHVRDDVISSIVLAVLEGELSQDDIRANAKRYITAYYREYDQFRCVSLDALIPGTDNLRYADILAAE